MKKFIWKWYHRVILCFLGVASVAVAAVVIEKSTEYKKDTISITTEGEAACQIYDMEIALAGEDNEPLSGVLVYLDDDSNAIIADEQGIITFKNLTYGKHELHIMRTDGTMQTIPFSTNFDSKKLNYCRVDYENGIRFLTPDNLKMMQTQLVLTSNGWEFTDCVCYMDFDNNLYLDDGTVIDEKGNVSFSDGSSIKNTRIYDQNGEEIRTESFPYFNDTGLCVFADYSFLNPGRTVYFGNGRSRIIGYRGADLHNGFKVEENGDLICCYSDDEGEDEDDITYVVGQDGSVKFPDGQVVEGSNTIEEAKKMKEEQDSSKIADDNSKKDEKKDDKKEDNKSENEKEITESKVVEESKKVTEESRENENGETFVISAKFEEKTKGRWQQLNSLSVFSDSYDLEKGAFFDENNMLVLVPGCLGKYAFRISPEQNQVSFTLAIYKDGTSEIPLKFRVIYEDGSSSDWMNLQNADSVASAIQIDERVPNKGGYVEYELQWWWDDTAEGQDEIDTKIGKEAVLSDVNYQLHTVLNYSIW